MSQRAKFNWAIVSALCAVVMAFFVIGSSLRASGQENMPRSEVTQALVKMKDDTTATFATKESVSAIIEKVSDLKTGQIETNKKLDSVLMRLPPLQRYGPEEHTR